MKTLVLTSGTDKRVYSTRDRARMLIFDAVYGLGEK